jgi:hypothetical protein
MKREDRFIGHGNCTVGDASRRAKAWRLNCSKCSKSQVLPMVNGILPPDAVFKRFINSGWFISKTPEGDLCSNCRANTRRPDGAPSSQHAERSAVDEAERLHAENLVLKNKLALLSKERTSWIETTRKAERAATDTRLTVAAGTSRLEAYANAMRQLHELLLSDCVEEALIVIEKTMPNWPWQRRLPKKQGSLAPKEAPIDDKKFDQWLADLDRQHNDETTTTKNR